MPLWGNNDAATNSVFSVPAQLNKTANAGNRTTLYGNTTADAFVTGKTTGVFAVSTAELSGTAGVASITRTANGTGYTARPTVSIAESTAGVNATATAVGIVNSATVGDVRGSGYVPGEILTINGGVGTSATANISATEVNTIAIGGTPGSGYTNGEIITVATGTGTQATATVTTGAADTIPASLAITTRGSYTANPTLADSATTSDGAGTGLTVNLTMGVETLVIQNVGAYTTLPTLGENTPSGGSGSSVTVDLVIGCGPITITEAGSSYSSAPAVTFGGAGGSGTTATAALQTSEQQGIAHAGWALRTEGSGGRAGRVHYETLVAMGSITGDASDDSQLPE